MPAPNTAAEIGREGLLALAARVEAATGADRELDCLIAVAVNAGSLEGAYKAMSDSDDVIRAGNVQHHFNGVKSLQEARHYTASLDAALSLVPEGTAFYIDTGTTPGIFACHACVWSVADQRMSGGAKEAETPALALTAASLRAIAALKAQAVGEGEGS